MEKDRLKAVVQDLVPGEHGPYAVATAEGIEGSITFSLKPSCWREEELPEPGEIVVLTGVRKKKAGWRASSARFLKPSDETEE